MGNHEVNTYILIPFSTNLAVERQARLDARGDVFERATHDFPRSWGQKAQLASLGPTNPCTRLLHSRCKQHVLPDGAICSLSDNVTISTTVSSQS